MSDPSPALTTEPIGVLRSSRVFDKLRAGQLASCTKINLSDSRVVEIAALAGFDAVWLDTEHVANSIRDLEHAINVARLHRCDALVRVPRGSYSDLIRPLELDAAGIVVPHVMSADDARLIVHQTKFHPLGRRALDGGNADGAFCGIDIADYASAANKNRILILQIEDPEALDELDDIAAIDGVDALFFGPGDFTQGLGKVGDFDDPRVDEARMQVAAAARRHGKFAMTVGGLAQLPRLREMGYQVISVGADVLHLRQRFVEIAEGFGSAVTPSATAGVYKC